eukprot:jgi/Botrbrau1/1142/Bobra.0162s0033.1
MWLHARVYFEVVSANLVRGVPCNLGSSVLRSHMTCDLACAPSGGKGHRAVPRGTPKLNNSFWFSSHYIAARPADYFLHTYPLYRHVRTPKAGSGVKNSALYEINGRSSQCNATQCNLGVHIFFSSPTVLQSFTLSLKRLC